MNRLIAGSLLASILVTAGSAGETENRSFPSAGISAVSIETEVGSIEVVGVAKGDSQVQFLDVARDRCRLTAEVTEGTLTVSAVRPAQSSRVNCAAKVRILSPAHADIDALAGTGDINISSIGGNVKTRAGTGKTSLYLLKGSLTADAGSGTIAGTVASQDVRIQVGSGAVDLHGLLGSARVQIGDGNLRLAWKSLPASASVNILAGHGDSELLFPPDSKIHVQHNPPNRSIRNDFPEANGTSVFIQNASGGVSILKSRE